MSKRQATPDILSAVLTGEESPAPEKKEQVTSPAPRPSGQKKKPAPRKRTKRPAVKKEAESEQGRGEEVEKQKATFYLSETALADLENAWMSLRSLKRGKGSVSKSGIVEAALRAALDEYEAKGKNSVLAQALVD